jgi:hypothetical protein
LCARTKDAFLLYEPKEKKETGENNFFKESLNIKFFFLFIKWRFEVMFLFSFWIIFYYRLVI